MFLSSVFDCKSGGGRGAAEVSLGLFLMRCVICRLYLSLLGQENDHKLRLYNRNRKP